MSNLLYKMSFKLIKTITLLLIVAVGSVADAADNIIPKRIIIPYAPGTSAESAFRLTFQNIMSEFILEYRPGPGSVIGWNYFDSIKDKKNTAILASAETTLLVMPNKFKHELKADLTKFKPAVILAKAPLLFMVPKNSPIHTLGDLIRVFKGQEKFNVGVIGVTDLLVYQMVFDGTGTINKNIQPVVYKNGNQLGVDLINGSLDMIISLLPSSKALVDGGLIRIIASSAETQTDSIPIISSVIPNLVVETTMCLFVDSNVPADETAWYRDRTMEQLSNDKIKDSLIKNGWNPSTVPDQDRIDSYMKQTVDRLFTTSSRIFRTE
jgi:tripartite-type tricarboxylate transporter receptor subunit TctC